MVDVVRTFGGNRDLRADDRHVLKLGVVFKPAAIGGRVGAKLTFEGGAEMYWLMFVAPLQRS